MTGFLKQRHPVWRIFVLFVTPLLFALLLITSVNSPPTASAAPANHLNFQGRLLDIGGGLVSDGFYDIEFNLYEDSSGGSTLWTETWNTGTTQVRVTNGYFSVYLGEHTSFPGTIDWSDDKFLTMNVEADGEMNPRFKLTAVPYAFTASNLKTADRDSADSDDVEITTGDITTSGTSGDINVDTGSGVTANGSISLGATNASSLLLGRAGATLTVTGNASSTIVLDGVTISAGELNVLDNGIEAGDLITQGTATDEYCLTYETGGGALLAWQACGGGGSSLFTQGTGVAYLTTTSDTLLVGASSANGGKLEVVDTAEQLWLSYDASNYASFTTNSSGNLTIAPSGGNITANGNLLGASTSTATTATTSGTGTNTTTLTFSATTSFANNDVILIDNAGQDYYTRIVSGGTAASVTVSPAVTFETGRTVTKYNIQNIGATASDYTTASNRFFQGYFLGGVVTGSGSTTLSDGRLASTGALNLNTASSTTITGGATSNILNVNADNLTTGSGLTVSSTSGTFSSGNLLNIDQTAGYGTATTIASPLASINRTITTSDSSAPQVQVDNTTTRAQTSSSTSDSFSHTVSSRSNQILMVVVNSRFDVQPSSVTFNGKSLTKYGSNGHTSDGVEVSVWYLVNPDVTTANVTVNFPSNSSNIAHATNLYNVNQTTPLSGIQTAEGANGTASVVVPSNANNKVFGSLNVSGRRGFNPGGGQTTLLNYEWASGHPQSSYKTGTTSTTVSYSDAGWGTGGAWTFIGYSVDAVAQGGTTLSESALKVSSNCIVTAGACYDSSSVLSVSQGFVSSTGSVLKVTGAGTGNLAEFVDGSTTVFSIADGGIITAGLTTGSSTSTIQGGTGATAVRILSGSGGTISIGNGGVAGTIQIGNTTGAVTQTINIGNNATASSSTALVLGSAIGTSSTTLRGGSGGINLSNFTNAQAGLNVTNGGYLATQRASDFSTTGSTNDANLGAGSLVRLTGASAQTITGITGGADGRLLTIVNAAAQAATITNNDAGSTAANRVITGTGGNITLPAGASVALIYDSGASLWRVTGGVASTSGSAVTTLAAIGSTPNANGATISGNTLNLQPADSSFGGVVTTTAQSFAGDKTFGNALTVSGLTSLNGGLTVEAGDTFTFNGDAFTDLTGTGLQINSGSLETTLGISIETGEITDGTILNADLANSELAVNTGSGLQGGGNISLGGSRNLSLGDLSADWIQNGAYNIVLNNSSAGLRIIEASGGLYYGEFDVADLNATRLYTFPDASGEVSVLGQTIENGELANSSVTVSSGTGISGGGLLSLGGSLSLSANLGDDIVTGEVVDGTLLAADLNTTNVLGAGVNGYVYTYNNATGNFTLVDGATLGGASGVTSLNGLAGALSVVGNTQIGVSAGGSNVNLSINADSITASQLGANSVAASELASTTVGAGSYGSASSVGTFTVDADGRLTTAGNSSIAIAASQITSGTLSVDRGGTGSGTFTTNGVLYGNGTSALGVSSAGTPGQVLVANSSNIPTFTTFSGDVTVGATGTTTITSDAVGSAEVANNTLTVDDIATGGVATAEILNNTIVGLDLNYTNGTLGAGEDNYVLTYDNGTGGFTWIDGGTLGTTLSEAQVEDYIFDADNGTKTLSSGRLALSSLTYTGNLNVAQGGTGITAAGAAGGVYYSTGTAFANNGAGTSGQCLLSAGAGIPTWGNCGGSGAGAVTLQVAYDQGGTITTTDARNIVYTLANTTTDSDFLINIATSSTSKTAFQLNGTDLLRIDSNGIDLLDVDVADFTGATVTFDAGEILETEINQNTLDDSEIEDDSLTSSSLAVNSVNTSELASTTVSPGSYGSATQVATFTVDADGRLTAAGNTTISGVAPGGSAGGDLSGTYPNPTVARINGVSLGSTTATAGNLLIGSGTQWVTQAASGDVAVSSGGVFTIGANSVALGTDTTGDYVVGNTAGTGIALTGTPGEAWSPTIGLSYSNTLASNSLAVDETTFASTGIIFEGSGSDGFETLLTVTNPTADRTITLPNASGTVAVSASGNIALSATGNLTVTGQIPVANGGTGQSTLTAGGILFGNGTTGITNSGILTNGQLLIGDGSGNPTIGTLSQGAGITVTNGAGTINIASTLGVSVDGSEILNGTIEAIDLEQTNAATNGYVLSYDSTSGGFTWVDPAGVGGTNEAQVEAWIFDGDNTGTLSSGTLALNSLSYTGNLTVAQGGTGLTAAGSAGGVYYSTGTAFANSGAGTSGYCLLSNGAGAPSWGLCGGSGSGTTLQTAYDGGGTITTADNKNIAFNLADTTTDSDFIVDLLGTGSQFEVRDGGVTNLVVDGAGNFGVGGAPGAFKLDVTGSARVSNNLTVNGNTTLGDTTGDTITFTGRVNSNINPSADDTYDLGSSSLRWRDLYLGPASLHVYCSAAECTSARDWSLGVIETAGATQGNLRLGLAGANNLVVSTSGNVGIGSANPSQKLEVAGAIQAGNTSGDALFVGNDAKLVDINVANTLSVQGLQNTAIGNINLGASGVTIGGTAGSLTFAGTETVTWTLNGGYTELTVPSLLQIPNGIFVSGSTAYFTNELMARGGIQNDGGTLILNDSVQINGAITAPEGTLRDDGGGWVRTYGNTGWYSQTHGGGWYMQDTTWIRSYGTKDVYIDRNLVANVILQSNARVFQADVSSVGTNTGICRSAGAASSLDGAFVYAFGGCSSLSKYKDNQTSLTLGLNEIRQLKPKEFNWNTDNGRRDYGLIAEEVQAINPLLAEYEADGTTLSGVKYNILSVLAIKGIQELDLVVKSNTDRIANLEASTTSLTKRNLTVSNIATVKNLTVTGTTQLSSLKVTGVTEIADLKVDRIITKGNTPTAVLGATTTGQGSTHIITGNDSAGTFTVTTGTASTASPLASGEQIKVTFDKPFTTNPRVALTAKDAESASVRHYISSTKTGFTVNFLDAPQASTTYSFDYIIVQ